MTRRPWRVVVGAALIGAFAIGLASRLELKTAFSELLPHDDPGVVTLREMQKRVGDFTLMLVGIRSPDRAANLRYAEALTARLGALGPEVCELATYHMRDVRAFVQRNAWLYLDERDLEEVRDRVRAEITRRKNPLVVPLLDDESLEQMGERLRRRPILGGRFADGALTDASGQYAWVAALPPGGLFAERAGDRLLAEVERFIADHPPGTFHPEMRVLPAGPLVTAARNRQAIESDILWVTLICVALVAASIALFFRSPRALPFVVLPAVLGTAMAFAAAELAFGVLNSSTAFLGSIILGNGINYAIILMARYEEGRAAGNSIERSVRTAVDGVWRSTLASAIAAAGAYASLTVTGFRGFSQFGVMGAVGALACWGATFTLLPALLRVAPDPIRTREIKAVIPWPWGFGKVAALASRRPVRVLALGGVFTAAAIIGVGSFLHDPFEYDFRRLSARLNEEPVRATFNDHQESLFGRWPHPTLVLADRLDQVEPIRAAIRRQDTARPHQNMIGQIVTVYDVLPGTPEVQARKLALIHEIRRLASDPALEVLTADERARLKTAIPPDGLRALEPADLPPLARRPFRETDGTLGRVVLVYHPDKTVTQWNGHDLLDIATVLRQIKLPDGAVIETSGTAVVFGAMLRSVLRDGPIASAVSLLAVIAATFVAWRGRGAVVFPALATLLVGVLWMVGFAGLAGVRITFLNFIALPITFGIGVEYAVNVLARVGQDRDITAAVSSTGGAVALCSWTTIVGYGSLLASRTQALRGFGAMAILGEAACLLAAVIFMPAVLNLMGAKRKRRMAARG